MDLNDGRYKIIRLQTTTDPLLRHYLNPMSGIPATYDGGGNHSGGHLLYP